jgi:hypothetical protein
MNVDASIDIIFSILYTTLYNTLIVMDNKDLELLEFPRICEIIAGYCSFSISREMAMSLSPSKDIDDIRVKLAESKEAGVLIETDSSASAGGVADIRDYAVAASRGQIIDPKTLRLICTSFQTMRLLRKTIAEHPDTFPMLFKYADSITEFTPIEKCLGKTGINTPEPAGKESRPDEHFAGIDFDRNPAAFHTGSVDYGARRTLCNSDKERKPQRPAGHSSRCLQFGSDTFYRTLADAGTRECLKRGANRRKT